VIRALTVAVLIVSIIIAAHLGGCAPPPPQGTTDVSGTRFIVEHAATFRAARGDRASHRTVYVVTDTTTGVSYIAIEGCGTAQLVREGKIEVER
jgi:hypothetical protein